MITAYEGDDPDVAARSRMRFASIHSSIVAGIEGTYAGEMIGLRGLAAVCCGSAVLCFGMQVQSPAPAESAHGGETILLWPNGAPGAKSDTDADKPSLTIFKAGDVDHVHTGIVVCPGGGYVHLAMDHEGTQVAEWLNGLGISAFVLKYRLGPKYHYPVQLWDAQRAIRYVRAHAAEFGIEPHRIGIWGFSAGGHLASTAGTHFDLGNASAEDVIDRQSARPDFMILAYPVITLLDPYAHTGSRTALLGDHPDPALVLSLSNELQVTTATPPSFLFHTTEDSTVPVENSIEFYSALRKAGVPAEMHIYLRGQHGVGLAKSDPVLHTWTNRVADWLKVEGYR